MAGMFRWRLLATFLLVCAGLLPAVTAHAQEQTDTPAEDTHSVVVVFDESTFSAQSLTEDLIEPYDADTSFVYEHAIKGFAAELSAEDIAELSQDPRVAFVEFDQEFTAFAETPTGVDRIEADRNETAGLGSGNRVDVDIAILDTGIDHTHPALNVVGGTECISESPVVTTCTDGLPGDTSGHGTHVAGIAAGADGSEAVGVAPGANLWAVKVLNDDGSAPVSQIIAGIDWVTAHADTIEVANVSIGCECESPTLDVAITSSVEAGVVYTVAAGNGARDAATFSPANHPEVITASAMVDFDGAPGGNAEPTCDDRLGADDTFATFSNYGEAVDFTAPGACITSAAPGGGYATWSGTSMASPHVAGAAALYIAAHDIAPNSTRWEIVRGGLLSEWSVPQDSDCGFTGGLSSERFLLLAECGAEVAGETTANSTTGASNSFGSRWRPTTAAQRSPSDT